MKTLTYPAIFATLLLLLFLSSTCSAGIANNVKLEAYLSGGNTDNLLQDSTDLSETYTTTGANIKFYPAASAELTAVAEYNNYADLNTLDNMRFRSELRFIPTSDSSKLTLLIYGAYDIRDYRADNLGVNTADFNTSSADGMLSANYRLSPIMLLRAGAQYSFSGYENENIEDKHTVDFFTGVNRTLFGNTGFDFEIGLTTGNLEYTDRSVEHVGPVQLGWQQGGGLDTSYTVYDSLEQSSLSSYYLSPRISRTIGAKTGASLTMAYRRFIDDTENRTVFGYSTGILSPWVTDYEGEAALFSVKSFLIPRIITTFTFGYWQRSHLPTVEQAWLIQTGTDPIAKEWQEPNTAIDRRDFSRRFLIQLQLPFATHSGLLFEPYLSAQYENNNSNIPVYEFDSFAVTGGVNIRI